MATTNTLLAIELLEAGAILTLGFVTYRMYSELKVPRETIE